MTDTPGWVSPSSSGSEPEDVRPPADTPVGSDAPSATAAPAPAPAPTPAPPAAPPYPGAYGDPRAGQVPPQRPAQGGWTAPPGWGAQGGQPGWGQPGAGKPGWQPNWGMQPASPKPGVIPLRPLGVGEILDGSISTARKHWRTVLPLALVVAVFSQTTATALTYVTRNDDQNTLAVILLGVSYLISAFAGLVMTAMLTMVVSKAILGEQVSIGLAWRAARPQLWRLLGLTLLTLLIIVGIVVVGMLPGIIALAVGGSSPGVDVTLALGLIAGSVVALWVYMQLHLATPALMLEKQGIKAALSRSRRLVRGSWWRIFGITLLGGVLAALLAGIIEVPFSAIAGVSNSNPLSALGADPNTPQPLGALVIIAIGGVLGATLTVPISAGIHVLLYVDQRIRREALDLELARAAGLPEYGGTGWAGTTAGPVDTPTGGPTGAA
ncbi:DUF7847 domain-containing protein [Kitasatospora azatica]|uniref:DUF7847 domain-containing protein n=1 Tax=Kitasatospora azatica TaxID=58347 RepID=UPI00068AF932|nr:hypothetical protein [Kitasatospora azatica]